MFSVAQLIIPVQICFREFEIAKTKLTESNEGDENN